MKGILDADFIRYAVACAGEKRIIKVIHKSSGREKEFSNRSEFYGRDKNKSGGWLGELNKSRTSPFTLDEFEIQDMQIAEPIENVLHSAKLMYEGVVAKANVESCKGFIGKGDSFRVERSTLLKYKDNRKDFLRPIHMQEVTEYMVRKFNLDVVEYIESDDQCVIECYGKKDSVLIGVDKDYYSSPVKFLNYNRLDEGVIDCDCFGTLFLKDGKVRGKGRMHLAWQICSNDKSDNYAANCFSNKKWAEKSAYEALKDCKDDVELFTKIKEVFQILYPEPKIVTGWRGDEIEIDWRYVFNECFDMARMLRFEGDIVVGTEVMERLGVL